MKTTKALCVVALSVLAVGCGINSSDEPEFPAAAGSAGASIGGSSGTGGAAQGGSTGSSCVTGLQVACACPGNLQGIQVCNAQNTYDACKCSTQPDAGTSGAGGSSVGGSSGQGGSSIGGSAGQGGASQGGSATGGSSTGGSSTGGSSMGGSGGTTSTGGSAGTSTGGSSGQGGTTTTGGSGGSPQVCVPGTYNQEYCPSQCGSKQIGVKVCNTSGTGYGCKCLDPVCEPGLPATCGSNECPAGKVPLYKICVFDGSEFYPCICQDAGTGGSSGSGGTGQGGSSGTGGTAQGGSAGTGGTGGVVNCDVDNDGYKAIACGGDDCNDNDPAMNPGVSYESCDGKDNDCNGLVDEGCGVPPKMWYRDADGDGYGVSSIWQYTNLQPQGYVLNSGDCLDTNANVHPGATELCNGIDDNCDGQTDEGCGTPSATKLVCFYRVPDIAKHDYHAVLWSDKQQTVSTYNAVWGTFTVQNPKENDEFLFSAYRDPPSNNIWQYAGCQWDNPSQLNFEFACYIEKNGNKYATPEVQGVWNNQHNGCNLRVVVQASGATDWDTDGFVLPHDCNDNNADTHPGATDLVGGADNNCNGASDF